jgi:hypothetical protein
MRAFVAVVALLALCGCESPRGDSAAPSPPQALPADTDPCFRQVLADPEYQPLRGKLPPHGLDALPSQEQRADATMATPEQARLVASYHQQHVVPCRPDALLAASQIGPAFVVIVVETTIRGDANYLKLVEGKISWGEYNTELYALRVDAMARLLAARREFEAGQHNEVYEAGQRQAAMIAFGTWKRQQQDLVRTLKLLNPGEPTRLNDCSYFDTTVSCTTS